MKISNSSNNIRKKIKIKKHSNSVSNLALSKHHSTKVFVTHRYLS